MPTSAMGAGAEADTAVGAVEMVVEVEREEEKLEEKERPTQMGDQFPRRKPKLSQRLKQKEKQSQKPRKRKLMSVLTQRKRNHFVGGINSNLMEDIFAIVEMLAVSAMKNARTRRNSTS